MRKKSSASASSSSPSIRKIGFIFLYSVLVGLIILYFLVFIPSIIKTPDLLKLHPGSPHIFKDVSTTSSRSGAKALDHSVQPATLPNIPLNSPDIPVSAPKTSEYRTTDVNEHDSQIDGKTAITRKSPVVPQHSNTDGISPQAGLNYAKKMFPEPITYSSQRDKSGKAVLVVGGTDGSGTRAVVQMLTQLGVTMVSEDPETYDIHADLVGGWPPIVSPVLKVTRSLKYKPKENLSSSLYEKERAALTKLLARAELDSKKPQSHRLAVGGALPKRDRADASYVSFGFKAPVAMTLSPWWDHVIPRFKLLHVLRDGRDIAFSANQGPVNKFYADFYGSDRNLPQVKAIRLWSDWNTEILEWAQQTIAEYDSQEAIRGEGEADSSFAYFAIHSEDLVSPNVAVKFAAIKYLAIFVGSNLNNKELCIIANEGKDFMGSHDRTHVGKKDSSQTQLAKRYGKWRAHLADPKNAKLKESMYQIGGKGLSVFGYEPLRELADETMVSNDGFQCTIDPEVAASQAVAAVTKQFKASDYAIASVCSAFGDIDYVGEDLQSIMLPEMDMEPTACCMKCKITPGCKHFTIDPTHSMCYMKTGNNGRNANLQLVSGDLIV